MFALCAVAGLVLPPLVTVLTGRRSVVVGLAAGLLTAMVLFGIFLVLPRHGDANLEWGLWAGVLGSLGGALLAVVAAVLVRVARPSE